MWVTSARAVTFACGLAVLALGSGTRGGVMHATGEPRFPVTDATSISRTLRFSGPGVPTLDLRAINGSIRVTGYSGSDVQLEAQTTIRAETDTDLAAARREVVLDVADDASTVGVTVRDARYGICGEGRDGAGGRRARNRYLVTIDLTARVPVGSRLRLCTVNGREVSVSGTAGDFEIDNVNGRITMDRISGSGRATTVNGGVTVSFVDAPREASQFKTVNGALEVSFPLDLAADLRMKTLNGGLFTDFDTQPLATTADPPERRNGRFVYHANRFTAVRVGRGGPRHTFETVNGDVRVFRVAG